ncbi:MAG: hypothetical protein NTU86_06240 [Burkholderiales bacterium]|nr:hypothetical protein [Burkholderiales bacterium]
MFGFFKKKPLNAMDEFIRITYGNPPPPKSADTAEAAVIAHSDLLQDYIDIDEVGEYCWEQRNSPIPYSTNDLAVAVAIHFYRQEGNIVQLSEAQLASRAKILQWLNEGSVNVHIAKSFEDCLYRLYKHSEVEIAREKLLKRMLPIVNEAEYLIAKEFSFTNINWFDDLKNRQGLIAFAAGVTTAISNKYQLKTHESGVAIRQIFVKFFKMNEATLASFVERSGKPRFPEKWSEVYDEGFKAASSISGATHNNEQPFFGKLSIYLEKVNPRTIIPADSISPLNDDTTSSCDEIKIKPSVNEAISNEKTVEEKLQSISNLRKKGLITESIYEQKQRDILKDI